ncbi:MAG: DNA polymerase I [Deltaproteobacteria bacterium]|nr:DNA polymerase I [Deltaproteobacteria bacterium]
MSTKKFFLIDAMAMAFRCFKAMEKRPLLTSRGLPTSAIYCCAQILIRLWENEKPDYLVMACDSREDTFRHEMFEDYKAHRKEFPEDLSVQMPYLFRMFDAFGLKTFRVAGFEADDIIASLVAQFSTPKLHSYIVSGDKDFMQLISDRVSIYSPQKGGLIKRIDEKGVFDYFHCKPHEVIDVLALKGDNSDNVPGVEGVGDKGAAQLIAQFHSLENLYEHLDDVTDRRQQENLRAHKEDAFLSKRLVTLKTDLNLDISLDEMACDWQKVIANDGLIQFFEEMEFRTLVKRLQGKRASAGRSKKAKPLFLSTEELIRTHVKDPLKRDYKLANNADTFSELMNALHSTSVFSFDTETTGLSIVNDKPIGISFGVAPGKAFYVPLLDKHLQNLDARHILNTLDPIWRDKEKLKVAHNLKFDMHMLANLGVTISDPVGDTMIAGFLLDATDSFGIDALSRKFINVSKIPTSALMGKKKDQPMSEVDLPLLTHYACEDADCCLRLHEHFLPRLKKEDKLLLLYETIEMPLVRVLADMERVGICVNTATLEKLSGELSERAAIIEREVHTLAGEQFNLNSPKQLQIILYEKLKIHEALGVKQIKKTKSGLSTDVSVLETLSAHPLVKLLLEYRTIMKMKGTYADTLPLMIDEHSRIHTTFHQTGTATGRLSSSNPNLQNIPIRTELGRKIRAAFEGQGELLLVSADYSQIELRILAHITGDKNLSQAFATGLDVHAATAAAVFEKPLEDVSREERSNAKAINYGIAYGMGPQRLSQTTGISVKEARNFIAKYFTSFPKIREYMDEAITFATTHGFTKTLMGRQRPLEGLDRQSGLVLANARNVAINSPIQGTAADLIKLAMIAIHREIKKRSLSAKMLLQIHDELVFECPPDELKTLCPLIKEGMEGAMKLSVPLDASIGYGKNWLEAHQ